MGKKLLILCTLLIMGFLFFVYACEKGVSDFKIDQLEIREGKILHRELHRAIEYRPRDNKKCNCDDCFGICGIGWVYDSSETNNIDIIFDVTSGKARIYFPETLSHTESEFGIDNDLTLPSAIISTGYSNGKLEQGLYSYNFSVVNYVYNGTTKVSYGYVDVDYVLW